jgi:hypothetical protein
MDHLKLLREIEQKWESHRRVLREMGWEEDKINQFLDKAKDNILAHESKQKLGVQ